MDLTGVLDALGAPATTALAGLMVGLLFGVFAQRSRFCLRAAVVEFARGSLGSKVALWLIAFAAAVLFTQGLMALGRLDVSEARQLAGTGSLSGAIVGGLIFGVGMVLTRGCPSRLLVLAAGGNLRALVSGLLFAVTAQATLNGALAPARDAVAGWWVVRDASVRDGLTLLGLDAGAGVVLGGVFMAGAILVALRNRLSAWVWVGGLGVGATVAAAWWVTYTLSWQAFDPVQVEGISFTGPSAETLMLLLAPPGAPLDFDIGLIPGVFLGSFLAAWLARDLKLEGFAGGFAMRRYIAGAVLMGAGGMLAGGCAVGAGVTGGAVFALTAWVALFCMWVGATLADLVVDRRGLILRDPDVGEATAVPRSAPPSPSTSSAGARPGWVALPPSATRDTPPVDPAPPSPDAGSRRGHAA
ncbi:YeeE/YedE family protein [Roseospira visakhapatnamensis]|uniref:Sulfur transporter n=1 Tax=Roseospira visakhapatnamensis TaxID=390880 RepID=A0A7W6RCN8_9PROT|nr:YeeE/YedE family protein [Roseospira visakhapatnamensis]MBB4265711.1 hypothetical protein [Roseospira visakhapatnamensis]